MTRLECSNSQPTGQITHRLQPHPAQDIGKTVPCSVPLLRSPVGRSGHAIFKNLLVLSVAFLLIFTAFVSVQTLQSSLNAAEGLGVASLCGVYATTAVSCLLAPILLIRLTAKWTIVSAFCVLLLYLAANFYPEEEVLLPASVALGLLAGPLWSAQGTYLTGLALHYASDNNYPTDNIVNKFNGIFQGVFQTSQVWGNLVTAWLLADQHVITNNFSLALNLTEKSTDDLTGDLQCMQCGARDCGVHDFLHDSVPHHTGPIPQFTRHLLLSIYMMCALLGLILVTCLLDKHQKLPDNDKQECSMAASTTISSPSLLIATLRMIMEPKFQLLLPLVIFTGLHQGFVYGDFTKSYVNCSLGIHKLGHVMICFGAVTAVASITIGHIMHHMRRVAVMTSGLLFHMGLVLALLRWTPDRHDVPMFYVIAGCLGLCDAIWTTQINTLFGVLFAERQEAAFSGYRMFQAVGMSVAFGYSYLLCVETKLYILASFLLVGMLLYGVVEFFLHKQEKLTQSLTVYL